MKFNLVPPLFSIQHWFPSLCRAQPKLFSPANTFATSNSFCGVRYLQNAASSVQRNHHLFSIHPNPFQSSRSSSTASLQSELPQTSNRQMDALNFTSYSNSESACLSQHYIQTLAVIILEPMTYQNLLVGQEFCLTVPFLPVPGQQLVLTHTEGKDEW